MKKIKTFIINLIMICLFPYFLTSCKPKKIELISLSAIKSECEVEINTQVQLEYSLNPIDATIDSIIWSSVNDEIASVNESGLVTAKKIGSTTINLNVNETFTQSYIIKVIYSKIEKIGLNLNEVFLNKDESIKLEYNFYPETINPSLLKWINSNSEIAIYELEEIKAIKGGITKLTLYYDENNNNILDEDELSANCNVYVSDDSILFNQVAFYESYGNKRDLYLVNFKNDENISEQINYIEGEELAKWFTFKNPKYENDYIYHGILNDEYYYSFNGCTIRFNVNDNKISFDKYSQYLITKFDLNNKISGDPCVPDVGIVKSAPETKYIVSPSEVVFDLNSYNIYLKEYDNHLYIPFEIASKVMISEYDSYIFNGKQVFNPTTLNKNEMTYFYSTSEVISIDLAYDLLKFKRDKTFENNGIKYFYYLSTPLIDSSIYSINPSSTCYLNGSIRFLDNNKAYYAISEVTSANRNKFYNFDSGTPYYEFDYIEDDNQITLTLNSNNSKYIIQKDLDINGCNTFNDVQKTYNYNLLCFNNDYFYGLKESLEIESFDTFFKESEVSLYYLLSSKANNLNNTSKIEKEKDTAYNLLMNAENPTEYDEILTTLIYQLYDESHTYTNIPSLYGLSNQYLFNEDSFKYYTYYSNSKKTVFQNLNDYTVRRNTANNTKINISTNYRGEKTISISKTAIMQFDSFVGNEIIHSPDIDTITNVKDYETLVGNNTYRAFKKFFRSLNKAKIDNVVIDITCNSGGYFHLLPITLAFLTDDPCIIIKNNLDKSVVEYHYKVDINQDGIIDNRDTYANIGYNFFILVSDCTFSCASSFALYAKENNLATIIGANTTLGGSCFISNNIDYFGSIYYSSSSTGSATKINDSYYTSSSGVSSSSILELSKWYDYSALASYVESYS